MLFLYKFVYALIFFNYKFGYSLFVDESSLPNTETMFNIIFHVEDSIPFFSTTKPKYYFLTFWISVQHFGLLILLSNKWFTPELSWYTTEDWMCTGQIWRYKDRNCSALQTGGTLQEVAVK